MKTYQYTSPENTVVAAIDADGISRMSMLASLVPEGGVILPYAPPVKTAGQIWEDIKAIRDRKTQHGGYKVGTDWFHSDTFSRTQQIGLTIMGASMPQSIMWKTMAGNFVAMTPTLAQQIFAAAGAQDAALFGYAEQLKAQVEAAADPMVVDINAGWPETYGGV